MSRRVLLSRAFAASATALLVACSGTALPPLEAPLPDHWRHGAATADAPAAAPIDLRGWWHAFGDPALDALVSDALANNLDVAQARERLLAARSLYHSDEVRYLPRLRAKTEDAIDPDASASFFVAGFDAIWELDLFGRGLASRRQAKGQLDASAATLQETRVSLVAEVVRDWLTLRAAQQREIRLNTVREARARQLDLLRVRQQLRLTAPQGVDQAQADLALAQAALVEPRNAADAAAQRLAVLLGRSEPDPAWLQVGALPRLGNFQLTQAPADLLRTRPEIAHAEADVISAAGDAGIARADLYPNIGIGGSLLWSTNLTTHRNTSDNAIASAGPIIDIPLFDWGQRQAQLHASEHELKARVLAYRQTVLQGAAEVETALGQLQGQRERERANERAVAALQHADRTLSTRVRLNLAAPSEQLDGRIALADASLGLIEATAARDLAFVGLYKALGGAPLPSEQDARAADIR